MIGQLGKLLGLSIDARDPLPQLWEVLRELGSVSGPTVAVGGGLARVAVRRCGCFMPRLPAALIVVVARDRGLVGARSAGSRRRGRRRDPVGPARASTCRRPRSSDVAAARCRRRSASSSSRSPTRSSPRARSPGSTTSTCAPRRSCSRWAPRTPRPGSPRGSRSARAARAPPSTTAWAPAARSPGLVAAGHRRSDPALPDRAGAVPAEGRARRGDRLRGDRARRAGGLARARGRRPRRGRDRRRHDRLRVVVRRARGDRRRRRALDRSTRSAAAPAPTTRCSAGSSGSAATPTSRCTRRRRSRPGVVVYRLDDRLFFANAALLQGPRSARRSAPHRRPTRWLVFDAEAMTHVDSTGLEALADARRATSAAHEITLVVARLQHAACKSSSTRPGVTETIGPSASTRRCAPPSTPMSRCSGPRRRAGESHTTRRIATVGVDRSAGAASRIVGGRRRGPAARWRCARPPRSVVRRA